MIHEGKPTDDEGKPTDNKEKQKKCYFYTADFKFVILANIYNGSKESIDSKSLYIREEDHVLDTNTALDNLINNGLIVSIGEPITLEFLSSPNGVHKYREYRFYRELEDKRERYQEDIEIDRNKYERGHLKDERDKALNENDCLKFAESLTLANDNNSKDILVKFAEPLTLANDNNSKKLFETFIKKTQTTSILKVGSTEFGKKDHDNWEATKSIDSENKNNNAKPNNGESYAIVNRFNSKDEPIDKNGVVIKGVDVSPYHIAFVLYSHNGVNITLEASDGGYDHISSDHTLWLPKFSFYSTNENDETFHKCYRKLYKNAHTIVLKSRQDKKKAFTVNKYDRNFSEFIFTIYPEGTATIPTRPKRGKSNSFVTQSHKNMETQSPTIQPLNKRPRTLTPQLTPQLTSQLTSQEEQPTKYLRRSTRITDKSPRSQIGGTKKKKTQKNTRKHKNK